MNYEKMFTKFKQDDFFLKRTQPLDDHDLEIKKMLDIYYNQKGLQHRLATLLNSIFTQQTQTFLFSRKHAVELFKQDDLSKYRTVSHKDYSLLLAIITNSPDDFQVLRKPTNNKAGVYKLIEPQLVDVLIKLVGKKMLEAQEKKALDYYDQDEFDSAAAAQEVRKGIRDKVIRSMKNGN
jgi:hypothetical protein